MVRIPMFGDEDEGFDTSPWPHSGIAGIMDPEAGSSGAQMEVSVVSPSGQGHDGRASEEGRSAAAKGEPCEASKREAPAEPSSGGSPSRA